MAFVRRVSGTMVLLVTGACTACSDHSKPPTTREDGAAGSAATADSCNGEGTPFVLPVTAGTPDGEYTATLTAAKPSPFSMGDNDWTLRIDDANGQPAPGIAFSVVPWMPEHRHGAVKTVVVTGSGGGEYEAKPINANMPGIWEIRVEFAGDGGTERRAVFSFCATAR